MLNIARLSALVMILVFFLIVLIQPVNAQMAIPDRPALFTFMSSNGQSGLGLPRSMAAVPDVNGDDIADLALGASAEDNGAGRVYVLSGADGTLIHMLNSPP